MLADLHSKLEQIEQWAAREGLRVVADAVKAAAALAEKIILEEIADSRAALETIGRTVSSLQAIVLEGRNPNEVSFPQELGVKVPARAAQEERPANGPAAIDHTPAATETPALFDKAISSDFPARQDSVQSVPVPSAPPAGSDQRIFAVRHVEGIRRSWGTSNEAREHLDAVDMHLLTLETDPHHEEALNSVFRAFHTIKGVAGMLGLSAIGSLAHKAENLLDRAANRNWKSAVVLLT